MLFERYMKIQMLLVNVKHAYTLANCFSKLIWFDLFKCDTLQRNLNSLNGKAKVDGCT